MLTAPKHKFTSVDEYIATFPAGIKEKLELLRATIKQAAPHAKEIISYNMPAYKQHGVLVYFAANKEHIGFYPTSSPIMVFQKELAPYKTSKGAVQFPNNAPIPVGLVADIVLYRIHEDAENAARKKKK